MKFFIFCWFCSFLFPNLLPSMFLSSCVPPSTQYISQTFLTYLVPVSESKELPEVVRTVLKQEITRLFGDSNAKSFNQAYLTKHSNSIPHRLAGRTLSVLHTHTLLIHAHTHLDSYSPLPPAAAKMMVNLDSSTETKAAELATALDESLSNRTIQVCVCFSSAAVW